MRERTEKPQAPSIPEERVRNVMHRSILLLVVATAILTLLGLLMVFSAITPGAVRAEYEDGPNLFRSAYLQMAYAAIGTVLAVICARIPLAVFQRLWGLALGFGILLQLLVLSPMGASVAGNRNWIAFGPIRLQPSEFLKLAMVVALAEGLTPPGTIRKIGKLTGGLVLLVSILQPVVELDPAALTRSLTEYKLELGAYSAQLEEENGELMKSIIEEQSAAYILDKAAQQGIACQVTVQAAGEGEWPVPETVTVQGTLTGEQREALERQIEADFAIPVQRQFYESGDGA